MLTGNPPPRLRCAACGGDWYGGLEAPVCRLCENPPAFDDLGIARLAPSNGTWPSVPPAFAQAVLGSTTADEVITVMTRGPNALPTRLQQQLLQPSGGAAAVLAPPRERLSALDLGTGWSNLASALGSMGVAVTSADWSYARLRFARLMQQPSADLAVHIEPGRELPFHDQVFDVVFADHDEIDLALRDGGNDGRRDHAQVLTEIHRVLKDGGSVVYGTTNPLRRRSSDSGRRRVGGLRTVPQVTRLTRSLAKPWDEGGLSGAGFSDIRVVAAHPSRHVKHWLVPLERLRDHFMTPRATASTLQALKQQIRMTAARIGADRWMVSDYYVLAHREPRSDGARRTLVESLEPFQGDKPPLVHMLSDARVAVIGTTDFVKFPLSVGQQQALLAEVEKTAAARETALRPFVIPSAAVGFAFGVPYTIFPRVAHRTDARPAEALQILCSVLDCQVTPSSAAMEETALWRRMATTRGRDDIAELEAEALHRAVLADCARRVVPVGPTHGDLHLGNVLLARAGGAVLVDWNRFESCNPLVLDAAYAAVRGYESRTRATLATSMLAFVDGELDDALALRAQALLGDLDRLHAAVLLLLDRIVSYSEPRRRHKPWTMRPLQEAVHGLSSRL